jgi:hypothetical protein
LRQIKILAEGEGQAWSTAGISAKTFKDEANDKAWK